jgi:hypothetical protein
LKRYILAISFKNRYSISDWISSKLNSALFITSITISTADSTIPSKTEEERTMEITSLICVTIQRLTGARVEMVALLLITRLNDYTILKNIKQSSARNFQNNSKTVSMANTVLSPTLLKTSRQELSTSCRRTVTFTCTTSKLNGVHLIKNTIKHNAITRITGKISEEIQHCSLIQELKHVRTGNLEHSSVSMRKAVCCRLAA